MIGAAAESEERRRSQVGEIDVHARTEAIVPPPRCTRSFVTSHES